MIQIYPNSDEQAAESQHITITEKLKKAVRCNQWKQENHSILGVHCEEKALQGVGYWNGIWTDSQWCSFLHSLGSKFVSLNSDSSSQLKVGLELTFCVHCTPNREES